MIRDTVFIAVILAITGAHALKAQSGPPDEQQPSAKQQDPRELTVAPNAAQKTPEARPNPGPGSRATSGPANVCAELVTFLEKKAALPPKACH
jgi:hypothetical protein